MRKAYYIFRHIRIEKLYQHDTFLNLNPRNLLLFSSVYTVLLFIINVLMVVLAQPASKRIDLLLKLPFSLSLSLVPCDVLKINSFSVGGDTVCTTNFGLILLYSYFAALSFLLIFKKKLKFLNWIIGFTAINLIAGFFIMLKAYIYLSF